MTTIEKTVKPTQMFDYENETREENILHWIIQEHPERFELIEEKPNPNQHKLVKMLPNPNPKIKSDVRQRAVYYILKLSVSSKGQLLKIIEKHTGQLKTIQRRFDVLY